MTLGELITWLEVQHPGAEVADGFGAPHTDRGDYFQLAFDPVEKTTIVEMLEHAQSALGKTFYGYKGGLYMMSEYTPVRIGAWGECGEDIGAIHLKYWALFMR